MASFPLQLKLRWSRMVKHMWSVQLKHCISSELSSMIGFYFLIILKKSKNKTQRFKRFPEVPEVECPFLAHCSAFIVNYPKLKFWLKLPDSQRSPLPTRCKRWRSGEREKGEAEEGKELHNPLCLSAVFPVQSQNLVAQVKGCVEPTLYPRGTQQINWGVFALSCHHAPQEALPQTSLGGRGVWLIPCL